MLIRRGPLLGEIWYPVRWNYVLPLLHEAWFLKLLPFPRTHAHLCHSCWDPVLPRPHGAWFLIYFLCPPTEGVASETPFLHCSHSALFLMLTLCPAKKRPYTEFFLELPLLPRPHGAWFLKPFPFPRPRMAIYGVMWYRIPHSFTHAPFPGSFRAKSSLSRNGYS